MGYPAHIRTAEDGTKTEQSVQAHCARTAELCAAALKPLGLGSTGRLLGLVHDLGKCTAAFAAYITRAAEGEPVRRGSVNHTFAAVQYLFERYAPPGAPPMRRMLCELLSFAVGAHHGQFDCVAPDGSNGFLHRLRATDNAYREAKAGFFTQGVTPDELDRLFSAAERELLAALDRLKALATYADQPKELLFFCSLLARVLLSALIDADRRDTAEFMGGQALPDFPEDLTPLWQARLRAVEARLDALPQALPIDRVRREISELCRGLGEKPAGVYRISVPTGGGKTLASLRAALAHAAARGSRRLVFVTPLLSVLEQNAAVLRSWLGDDSMILEHHSNAVLADRTGAEELDRREFLTETWDAPIIITTLVQLLNTFFDGRTACIRRFQALRDSVLVIDEVQSVSKRMLTLFDLAINFLAGFCGATVLLCSATQPDLDAPVYPLRDVRELVPWQPALWTPFRRTEILDRRIPGGYDAEALAAFAAEQLTQNGSLLVICNKKAQAAALFALLRKSDARVFHLSTSMCMAHRIEALSDINDCLRRGERTLCVSTQLVEAGVDFSFGCVIRVFAGLDNAIQSAGRCNRSGEKGRICPVYLVNWKDEDLSHLKDILQAQEAAAELLATCCEDMQLPAAILRYYRLLYKAMPKGAQDGPTTESGAAFDLLSANARSLSLCQRGEAPTGMWQAFKTAGDGFRVFDDDTTDVLVPYKEGKDILAALCSERAQHSDGFCKAQLAKGKRYTVTLFDYQLRRLRQRNAVYTVCGGAAYALQPSAYDCETGVTLGLGGLEFMNT